MDPGRPPGRDELTALVSEAVFLQSGGSHMPIWDRNIANGMLGNGPLNFYEHRVRLAAMGIKVVDFRNIEKERGCPRQGAEHVRARRVRWFKLGTGRESDDSTKSNASW